MTEFTDLGLQPDILASIAKMGFKNPTPIQEQTIPLILQGRDMVGLAETGSGKTAACAIPICNKIDINRPVIQALIVVPTRELALQYATETQTIGGARGIHSLAVYGGGDAQLQLAKLKHKVHICIATPGRLIDFIYSRQIDLTNVTTIVLDEADEMLSMGFIDDLEFVFRCLVHDHQTLLFSATMPKAISAIAANHMKDPALIKLTSKVAGPSSLKHQFVYCAHAAREKELERLMKELKPKQSIVFVDSRIHCEKLQRLLHKSIPGTEYIHGGLSQESRTSITQKFRKGKINHLIATDVAARGLDFSGVTHVFQFQVPKEIDSYIHRSGRTGRQSREGTCVTLVTKRDLAQLEKITQRIDRKAEWLGEPPSATAAGPVPQEEARRPRPQQRRRRPPPKKTE